MARISDQICGEVGKIGQRTVNNGKFRWCKRTYTLPQEFHNRCEILIRDEYDELIIHDAIYSSGTKFRPSWGSEIFRIKLF